MEVERARACSDLRKKPETSQGIYAAPPAKVMGGASCRNEDTRHEYGQLE